MTTKKSLGAAIALTLGLGLGMGSASATLVYNSDLAATWAPPGGSGQLNGHFVIENQLGNSGIELGLRVQQRRVGPITPDVANFYTVQPGLDPGTTNRAWWNFDWSATYGNAIGDLDSLILRIYDQGGLLNTVDLLAFASFTGVNVATTATIQESWNPLFGGVGVPGYDVTNQHFAYWFTLTATDNGEITRSLMCVRTSGDSCGVPPPLPEPASLALVGLALTALARTRRRRVS